MTKQNNLVNDPSENFKLFLSFIETLQENNPKEYSDIEFLKTTKEHVELYCDRAIDFQVINNDNIKPKNSRSITLKTIKDLDREGLIIAFSDNQIIGYTRFSKDQRLKAYLKKKFNPIEFSEIYVLPD